MKTPITDAALERLALGCDDSCLPIYVYVDGKEYVGGAIDADTARKLESDRAALMSALIEIASTPWIENALDPQHAATIAESAIATAQANFPEQP
jgi:hypothetical protein